MLTELDDLTIHQIPYSMDHVEDRNPRWVDKLWFHVGSTDGSLSVAGHMGVYPATMTMDASAAVVSGGKQYNVRLARELQGDRDRRVVGGLSAEIVEPFKAWRFALTPDSVRELSFELEFNSSHQPMEVVTPIFHRQDGRNIIWNLWHYAQTGNASGTVSMGGQTLQLTPQASAGARDRSWGVRPIFGQIPTLGRVPESIASRSVWLAAEFAGYSLWFWLLEPPNHSHRGLMGNLSDQTGRTRVDGAIAGGHEGGEQLRITGVESSLDLDANGKSLRSARFTVADWDSGSREVAVKPLTTLYSKGLGYGHAEFRHNEYKGRDVAQADVVDLADSAQIEELLRNDSGHINPFGVEHFCEIRCGDDVGHGVVRLSI